MKKFVLLLVALALALPSVPAHAVDSWPLPPSPRGWNNLEKLAGIRLGQWLPCDPTIGNTNDCIESITITKLDGSLSGTLKYLPNPQFDPMVEPQIWDTAIGGDGVVRDNYPHFKNFADLTFELPEGFITSDGGKLVSGHAVFMGGLQVLLVAQGDGSASMPTDSIIETTVRSKKFKSVAGWVLGNIKNPIVKFSGDLVSVAGTPQPSPAPTTDCSHLELGNSNQARTSAATFALNLDSNNQGNKFAEVVVSTNGWWCFYGINFDQQSRQLVANIGTSHFDENMKEVEGWLELTIAGRIAREWWQIDPATAVGYAKVEVTYADGTSKLATVNAKYDKKSDQIYLRAYGFHYSRPAVKMSITQPKKSLTCVKGKLTKIISGSNSKCPTGYRKAA